MALVAHALNQSMPCTSIKCQNAFMAWSTPTSACRHGARAEDVGAESNGDAVVGQFLGLRTAIHFLHARTSSLTALDPMSMAAHFISVGVVCVQRSWAKRALPLLKAGRLSPFPSRAWPFGCRARGGRTNPRVGSSTRVQHRRGDFHPAVQVPGHPIGAAEVHLRVAAARKHRKPAVLQVASHDRLTRCCRSGPAPRFERANAPHHELMRTPAADALYNLSIIPVSTRLFNLSRSTPPSPPSPASSPR